MNWQSCRSVSAVASPGIAADLQKVFECGANAAESLKDEFVSTEHLLLGLTRTDSKAKQSAETASASPSKMF